MGRGQVSLFKRKKKLEEEHEIVANEIPVSTIFRWFLYDTDLQEDINELSELVGLSPISDEGDEKERQDSETRVMEVASLFNFLESMSEISARAVTAVHVSAMADSGLSISDDELEEQTNSMYLVYKGVSMAALLGAFSVAIELGMITKNLISSSVFDLESDDDNE